MSELRCEVVRVGNVEKHPEADTLSLTRVWDYTVIIKTGTLNKGDLAIYIPIDSVLPLTPHWEFVHGGVSKAARVKAKRLRGIFSQGLLVNAPPGSTLGANYASYLGITKWEEPPERSIVVQGPIVHGPPIPRYTDIENVRGKYGHLLHEGETVFIQEKIHGCNMRFGWVGDTFVVGSHNVTKLVAKEDGWLRRLVKRVTRCFLPPPPPPRSPSDPWLKTAMEYKLREKTRRYRNYLFYGEVYGAVQDLKYDCSSGEVKFVAFDVYDLKAGRYLDYAAYMEVCLDLGFPMPPNLYTGPWSTDLYYLAEQCTQVPGAPLNHISEGFVVRPFMDRSDKRAGRIIFKCVGSNYLLRKGGTERK